MNHAFRTAARVIQANAQGLEPLALQLRASIEAGALDVPTLDALESRSRYILHNCEGIRAEVKRLIIKGP